MAKQSISYSEICKQIRERKFLIEYNKSKKELIIEFDNIRLPTLNEILSGLQYRKFEIWNYKKTVKEVMADILTQLKEKVNKEYLFENGVDLYIYRRGKKIIDNDSLPACFKYFIDSFTLNNIIKDDSPDYIKNIKCFQEKGEPKFILKLKETDYKQPKIKTPIDFMREL